ncbi:hypothetical protein KAJ27_22820 [bacterium]|nr:hypothetical protein [bacterium]
MNDEFAAAYCTYGEILLKNGDIEKARKYLKSAKDCCSAQEEILKDYIDDILEGL